MTKFHTPIFFIVVGKMIDQKCLSNRLGITYSSTYHARDAKSILQLDKVPQVAKRSISERLDEFKKKAYDFESVRAAKNGTSVKKLRLRDIQKQSLTDINNAFHEHMSEFRKRARQFTDRFPIACQHMKADLLQDSYNVDFSMTSDDAKEVKTHHNKRTVNNNYNLDFSYSKPDEKRQRHHDK
ncbi:11428_t:CDS:2, partial [Rhizophagus irregularis]